MYNKDVIKKTIPDFPKRLIIGLQDGYCNLKCPMCHVQSSKNDEAIKSIRGVMPIKDACRIFDEVMEAQPMVNPITWAEPFVIKDIDKYILAMKKRNIPVTINSNGLLLTNKLVDFLIKIKIDSILISIDATTNSTYKKIRGVKSLDKIKNVVFSMLEKRRDSSCPRIGVSFVAREENIHEKEEFISYWIRYVDVVRVSEEFSTDRTVKNAKIPKKRIPCGSLYDTMVINHCGDVVICCLDSFYTMKIGNVFKSGVKEIWHSDEFQKLRYYHETSQYSKIPFCENCDIWASYLIEEEIKDNVLIRKSPLITNYNRMDKMKTWRVGK